MFFETEMGYMPHKDSYLYFSSSLNLFNTENFDVRVKHGYYEQFYPPKSFAFQFIPMMTNLWNIHDSIYL